MTVKINLEFLARDTHKAVERGDIIIIIDVLRFGSSALNAFKNGAMSILPVRTLEEARRLHRQNPESILAGERGGLKPYGFDCGNSPFEFNKQKIYGKTIIYTTTSGTHALTQSKKAKWTIIGVLLNAKAVAAKALELSQKEGANISLVQSGSKGKISLEDFLCAGAITERLSANLLDLSDSVYASLSAFLHLKDDLCRSIVNSEHGKHLVSLGLKRDIEFSCRLDLFSIVPIYRNGLLKIASQSTKFAEKNRK